MDKKTNIARYFVSWRFFCSILILMCAILFFMLLYQQNFRNPSTNHVIFWSVFQKSTNGTQQNESFTEVLVPTWRKPNISTAEESILSVTEILVPISTEHSVSEVEQPVWGADHIMFLETSCILNKGEEKSLLPRQICSIESAAKINPARKVYVLHSCPLPTADCGIGPIYSKYENIKFWPLNLDHLVGRSPLEGWDYRGHLHLSKWPREHGSDIARFLVLWHYGGTYLDTDVMLIREFSGITKENFLCRENWSLGSAVLRFLAHNETVHQLLKTVMLQVRNDFRGWDWPYNGPGALYRAIVELCAKRRDAPQPSSCFGVNLLPPKYFFEIPYLDWQMFFNESSTEQVMTRIKDSYGVHFWNKKSHDAKVMVGSRQAYAILAQKYCPHLYASVEPSF